MKKVRHLARKHKETILNNFGIGVALFFVLMLGAQLFSFEEIPALFAAALSIEQEICLLVASALVASELLALPFLLSMAISPLMKCLGMLLSVAVVVFWMVVASVANDSAQNVGLLGHKAPLPGGTWLAIMMLGFLALIAWHAKRSFWPKTRS